MSKSRSAGVHLGIVRRDDVFEVTMTTEIGTRRHEEQKWRELSILAVALVLSMSTWFSTAAVLPQLREQWSISTATSSLLTIAVQVGFVVGAVASAATNLADRLRPQRLILLGAAGAAAANAAVALLDSAGPALVARFVTGGFLALVYPPALKAMAGWFRTGRGLALGVMIGALTVGSALPHLVNALGGLDWRAALVTTSALTLAGGVIADRACTPGPDAPPAAIVDPRQIGAILRDRRFLLATGGYFGHMWELYAMWAWIAAFYGDVFSPRVASLAAFFAIGIGAAGAVHAGRISDRIGREVAARRALRWSAALAVVTGFLVDAPWPLVMVAGLVWGFWVVADSAQFSAIVTEVVDPRYVGTALTMQLASGFTLSVLTIFLVPEIRDAHGWGWAFLALAPGPLLGAWAMSTLRRSTVTSRV